MGIEPGKFKSQSRILQLTAVPKKRNLTSKITSFLLHGNLSNFFHGSFCTKTNFSLILFKLYECFQAQNLILSVVLIFFNSCHHGVYLVNVLNHKVIGSVNGSRHFRLRIILRTVPVALLVFFVENLERFQSISGLN